MFSWVIKIIKVKGLKRQTIYTILFCLVLRSMHKYQRTFCYNLATVKAFILVILDRTHSQKHFAFIGIRIR